MNAAAELLARHLADRLELRKRPRSWGGDCPSCSYHAAFSMKVGRGERPLLYCANGCTREQLHNEAERVLGAEWTPPPAPDPADVEKARASKQAAAVRLWNGAIPCADTPAAAYLIGRGLSALTGCRELRYRADTWHAERGRHPALIARVRNVNGNQVAVHRTYLTSDGRKAALDPPKASLGPVWGSAIHLGEPDLNLVVAEGIETAASAGLLLNLPAWAAISAGNMAAGLILPNDVYRVTIAADADGPGRKAAQDAAARWRGEGRHVSIATPNRSGADFNDVLQEANHA
ncbi:MAG: DUF7146 domain-containing protein [Janthinobacterium lividum]